MRNAFRFILLALSTIVLAACAARFAPNAASPGDLTAAKPQLTVFAAASLTEAFEEIAAAFAQTAEVDVVFNFAGSQQLAQQLLSGAPGDVFASANQKQMDVAVEGGSIAAAAVQPFAGNRLVIVTPADNPAALQQFADLAKPGVKLVLADAAVPVGQYALDMLAKASAAPDFASTFGDETLANVVSYEDNVRSVLAKVLLGEVDAGIVYSSDVTAANREEVQVIDIPDALNVTAVYVLAPVAGSVQPELAQAFVDYVISDAGQEILANYGFQRVAQ
jgi:molybdate transport system substrate-binding protein